MGNNYYLLTDLESGDTDAIIFSKTSTREEIEERASEKEEKQQETSGSGRTWQNPCRKTVK